MKLKIKLFLSSEDCEGLFGGGKWQLLNAINEHGSIKTAVESLNRSYRKAWGDIKKAEEGLGRPLVTRSRGGKNGGHAELTEFGKKILSAWDTFYCEMSIEKEKLYKKHLEKLCNY